VTLAKLGPVSYWTARHGWCAVYLVAYILKRWLR